ncbi:hypothetical protein TWF481_007436 [Arthrobotrys musiformis]|uniref:Retrotransposon Copia-like N-terminal domain-containing protein n=1 Tax=Arthrobotrys musiformis TaxID=47236 RepID=A0AAV9WDC2_9PEZI
MFKPASHYPLPSYDHKMALHAHTLTYTPKTFLLTSDNYLEWSIYMERCIERFLWKPMLYTPYDASSFSDSALAARHLLRRNECSTFILENIDTKYWFLFNPRERDPCVLWKDIRNVWLPKDSATVEKWGNRARNLRKSDGSKVLDYIAEARMYWENYKAAGGKEIKEKQMVEYVLAGILRKTFEREVSTMEDSSETEITLNHVLGRLLMVEADVRTEELARANRNGRLNGRWYC